MSLRLFGRVMNQFPITRGTAIILVQNRLRLFRNRTGEQDEKDCVAKHGTNGS